MRNRTATPSERLEAFDLTQLDSFELMIVNNGIQRGETASLTLSNMIYGAIRENCIDSLSEPLQEIAELITQTL